MEIETLLVDHVLEELLGGLEIVPGPVEHLLADDLLLLVVQSVEVGVSKALLNCVALVWIEGQHLGQEICSSGLDVGEELLPGLS